MSDLYKAIAMDPPWPEFGGGKIKRGADRHYRLIKTKEQILRVILQARGALRIGQVTDALAFNPDPEGCLLFMWATRNYRGWAHWLMEALGFKYVTDFVWVKGDLLNPAAEGSRVFKLGRAGLGQWSTSQHEHLLMGRIGKVAVPDPKDRMPSVIVAPTEGHSVKPAVFYNWIERVSPGRPRLEMFARVQREGWDTWGNLPQPRPGTVER